ncbi:hypothetical protein DRQ53_13200 [bacterium]|nr:MAG: hypothetical protein DRQ53_13200 [bacterium]
MIKKLSAGVLFLALVACAFAPATVQAQETIGTYFNEGGALQRYGTTVQGTPFEIAVLINTSSDGDAAEVVMTELKVLFPGIFKLGTTKINGTNLDLGDNDVGEYLIAFGACLVGPFELVRINYGDFAGEIGTDVIIQLRGFQPGDTRPSSFGGEPGFVTCAKIKTVLALEPWVDGDIIDPTKLPSIDSSDGVCVLNALLVPNEAASVGSLKARF